MMEDSIVTERAGPLGWLIFNNPKKHNAISMDMYRKAIAGVDGLLADPSIRLVVLRGAGERAFVSGGDISTFATQRSTGRQRQDYDDLSEQFRNRLLDCTKPTIAMIRGYWLGAGMSLALSCDLRMCSDDAKFGIPAARIGTGFGARGELDLLVDLVGPAVAQDILFTGRRCGAEEALRLGLVNTVLAAQELHGHVQKYAETIAANAPLSISAAKGIIALRTGRLSSQQAQVRQRFIDACFESQDYIEGRTAFLEKRNPRFTGR